MPRTEMLTITEVIKEIGVPRATFYRWRLRNIKTGSSVLKGYYAHDLTDAWTRYCPPPPGESATSATDTPIPGLTSDNEVAETADHSRYPAATGPAPATPATVPR
ncbi:helix-turn-helix transcriptional regulator [Streptomyces sp. MS19]|uniref:helix-turn-helix transcriptional regulator n=1 Tax=Streptomyces sp. MS19 TaxID=3385972 RepID=UPI0039A1DCCC